MEKKPNPRSKEEIEAEIRKRDTDLAAAQAVSEKRIKDAEARMQELMNEARKLGATIPEEAGIIRAPGTPLSAQAEKKETPTQAPKEEVADFVRQLNLDATLLEGLTNEQKLKVIRDLKKRVVDIVKSDAQTQYSFHLKEEAGNNINLNSNIVGRSIDTLLEKTGKALTKERDVKNIEQAFFARLIGAEEMKSEDDKKNILIAREIISDDFALLVRRIEGREVYISDDGTPCFAYVGESREKTTEEIAFNDTANKFACMPYEWGQERGGKHKKAYDRAESEYSAARNEILRKKAEEIIRFNTSTSSSPAQIEKATEEASRGAELQLLELDNAIKMEQLLNTHPEFEKVLDDLDSFGRNADRRETIKTASNILNTLTGKNFVNRSLILGGFVARMAAKFTPLVLKLGATGAAVSTAIAAPAIGGVIGGVRGYMRGQDTLAEKEKQGRQGQANERSMRDKEKLKILQEELEKTTDEKEKRKILEKIEFIQYAETRMVSVESLILALEKITNEVETSPNYVEKGMFLGKLLVIVNYAQKHLEEGRINFGRTKDALSNEFNFVNNLNRARVLCDINSEETATGVTKKIEELIQEHNEKVSGKISEAQKAFIMKQALKGAASGSFLAALGYTARYVWENVHFGGGQDVGVKLEGGVKLTDEEGSAQAAEETAGGRELREAIEKQLEAARKLAEEQERTLSKLKGVQERNETTEKELEDARRLLEEEKNRVAELEGDLARQNIAPAPKAAPTESQATPPPKPEPEAPLVEQPVKAPTEQPGVPPTTETPPATEAPETAPVSEPEVEPAPTPAESPTLQLDYSSTDPETFLQKNEAFARRLGFQGDLKDTESLREFMKRFDIKVEGERVEVRAKALKDTIITEGWKKETPATATPENLTPKTDTSLVKPDEDIAPPRLKRTPEARVPIVGEEPETPSGSGQKPMPTEKDRWYKFGEKRPKDVKPNRFFKDIIYTEEEPPSAQPQTEIEPGSSKIPGVTQIETEYGKNVPLPEENELDLDLKAVPRDPTVPIPEPEPDLDLGGETSPTQVPPIDTPVQESPVLEQGTNVTEPKIIPKTATVEEFREKLIEKYNHSTQPGGISASEPQAAQEAFTEIGKNVRATEKAAAVLKMLHTHPEFAKNPFHLEIDKLMETYEVHSKNLDQMTRTDAYANLWKNMKDQKVNELLKHNKNYTKNYFINYLREIYIRTGLKPKGRGLFSRAETVNEYIARALQKAATKDGLLEKLRAPQLK